MHPSTRRERRLWTAAAGYLLALFAAAYFVRFVVDWLRPRGLLAPTFWGIVGVLAAGGLLVLRRHRPGWRLLATAAAVAVAYAAAFLALERIEERAHFVLFGAFALLIEAASRERARGRGRALFGWPPTLVAMLATAVAGWLDELVQWALPNRVYDLRDVAFNALAGVLAMASVLLLRRARTADAHSASGG